MRTLIFHVLDAYVHESYGREKQSDVPDRDTSITLNLAPDHETRVTLTSGENLGDIKGRLSLKPSDDPRPIASEDKSRNLIGFIQYSGPIDDGSTQIRDRSILEGLAPK